MKEQVNERTKMSHFMQFSTRCAVAVAVFLAIATFAGVTNTHYDRNATVGGLHKVCDDFSIDASDVLSATCNKVAAGVVSQVSSSIDLSPDLDDECLGKFQSLTPLADSVNVEFDCNLHTNDLNDMAKWDANAGRLKLTAA